MSEKKYLICRACLFHLGNHWRQSMGYGEKLLYTSCVQKPRCFDINNELEFSDQYYKDDAKKTHVQRCEPVTNRYGLSS